MLPAKFQSSQAEWGRQSGITKMKVNSTQVLEEMPHTVCCFTVTSESPKDCYLCEVRFQSATKPSIF